MSIDERDPFHNNSNYVHKMIIFFNILLLQKYIIFIETDIIYKYIYRIYNINIILKAFLQLSTYYLQMNVRLTSPSSIYLQISTHNGDILIGE